MNNGILSKEDILCMQYAGMKASQIMTPKLMPEEYAEAFEAYIDKAESVMSMQEEYGVITLTFQDDNFPHSLRKIGNDCPPIIHCIGDLSLLAPTANRIAVIGARAASPIGLRKAYELGNKYAKEGNIIVSGLALGCDKSAHEGCLDADGRTIAIVASGLNITHPIENAPLQQRIFLGGARQIVRQLLRRHQQHPRCQQHLRRHLQCLLRLQPQLHIRMPAAEWQYAHHAFCPQISQTLSRGLISGIQ